MIASGLPDWRAWSAKIAFSRSTAAGSSSSVVSAIGLVAATCMAT
jgi:hypothetical protein